MNKLCLTLILTLFCGILSAQNWKPIRDSKVAPFKGGAAVQITGPGRGMIKGVGVSKPMLATISFEAKGNVSVSCNMFSARGVTGTPTFRLTDKWQRFSFTYYFFSPWQSVQFNGKKRGSFSVRDLKAVPVKLPYITNAAVPGTELDLTRGRHGKLIKSDGKTLRQGGAYSRLLLFTPPQTTQKLYLFAEVKMTGKGKQSLRLVRGRQPLASAVCKDGWVRLGPVPAEAMYPESELCLGGNRVVTTAVSRAVLTTDANWLRSKKAVRQTSAPQLVIGRGRSGVNAGPFTRTQEDRFAAEQSTVKLTYSAKELNVEFYCKESVLDPAANRLHDFKTQEKNFSKNDYVVFLLLRNGKMYDFFVNGTGRSEIAAAKGPSFWNNRDLKWKSGAKTGASVGRGFWKASISIPWKSIGGLPRKGEVIKFQAGRKAVAANELSTLFPTLTGFHDASDFGTLAFAEKVPEVQMQLPAFRPGKNQLQITGAPFIGKVFFPGYPALYFCSEDFALNRSGKFNFSWQIQDPATGGPLYNSPAYQLNTTASILTFGKGNSVTLNGQKIKSGALLNDGINQLEVSWPFKGTLKVNGVSVAPAGKKFTLAVNSSILWPNWQAQDLAVNRGALQMLLFSPNGFPGKTLSDYRLKLDLPKGFKLECASGYYKNYKLKYTADGEIRFLTRIPYKKELPSNLFVAAFIRVPADFKGNTAEMTFASGSRKEKIVEVPQKVKLRILPALKAGRPKHLYLQMCSGWLKMLTDKKYRDQVVLNLQNAGVNFMTTVPNKRIAFGHMFKFVSWSWSLAPYGKMNPQAVLTLKNGRKNPQLLCPEYIRKPEFYAWLKAQIPRWMARAENPAVVEWDYEYGYTSGPFSCYCSVCSRKTDLVSRNRNVADFARLMKKALKEHNPKTQFSIYSAYQSEKNKRVYGLDWSMVKDHVDFAICGYGRSERELRETQRVLGKTPLILGALVVPYSARSRAYPRQLTPAWLVRRLVDSTKGVLVYEYSSLNGDSLAACAELSRIMEKYEDFIRFGKRLDTAVPGWPEAEVQVIEYKGKKILFLMNSGEAPRKYKKHTVAPGKVLILPFAG